MGYIRQLAKDGGELLSKMWGTFTLVPAHMQPGMTNPVLPVRFSSRFHHVSHVFITMSSHVFITFHHVSHVFITFLTFSSRLLMFSHVFITFSLAVQDQR